jgi:two-component system response regulator
MSQSTILLVEDNPDDALLSKRALEKQCQGTEIIVAEDGVQALEILLGSSPGLPPAELPGLVLLDLKLPRIDGLEVLRRIRANERTRRLPVVILTSSLEEQDLAACYDLGCNSYIRKPVDFAQFLLAVKTLGMYWMVYNDLPSDRMV